MNGIKYEHHSQSIFLNELCPFKIKSSHAPNSLTANWHKNLEIIYITGGEGSVQCGAEKLPAQKGDIFVINPESIHHICSDIGIEYSFIIIDESFCKSNGILIEKYNFVTYIKDPGAGKVFCRILDIFSVKTPMDSELHSAKLRSAVLEFLILLCENYAESSSVTGNIKGTDVYARKAIAYISENFNRPICIEEIASKLGISKFHLAREFKNHTGETVIYHLNKIRCLRANQLIQSGYSVTEAAIECGFESGSYFSQIYKKINGISPSEYRRSLGRFGKKSNIYYVEGDFDS